MASSSPYIDVQGVKLLASRILYAHPLVSDIVIDRQHLLAFRLNVPLELLRILPQPGGSVRGERANLTRLVIGCIEATFCKKNALESSRRDLHNARLYSFAPFSKLKFLFKNR